MINRIDMPQIRRVKNLDEFEKGDNTLLDGKQVTVYRRDKQGCEIDLVSLHKPEPDALDPRTIIMYRTYVDREIEINKEGVLCVNGSTGQSTRKIPYGDLEFRMFYRFLDKAGAI